MSNSREASHDGWLTGFSAEMAQAIGGTGCVSDVRRLVIDYLDTAESVPVVWHPLGFIDIPVARNSSGKLVIHVWHPGFTRPQSPRQVCHSHGWILHSAVLAGRFENQSFEVVPDPAGEHRLYRLSYAGSRSVTEALDERVASTLSHTTTLSADQRYTIGRRDFHWSQELGTLAVTAMYASFAQAEPAYIVRRGTDDGTYVYPRQPCDRHDRNSILADVRSALRD